MTDSEVVTPGVPSAVRDGTPMRLDPAIWEPALEALEFQQVLEVIAGFATGPLGAAAIRDLGPVADAEWMRAELARISDALALARRGVAVHVGAVPELRGALGRLRFGGAVLEMVELVAVRVTLAVAHELAAELDKHAEAAPLLHQLRVEPVDRGIVRMLELAVGDDGELLDSASPALAAARREVHRARERLIRRLEQMLRDADATAVPAGASVTVRGGRYVIPVRRDARQRPEGIIHDESGSAGTLFIEPTAVIEFGNALRSAVVDEERQVLIVLRELTDRLRPHRDAISALHRMSVVMDSLVARARWAHESGGDVPVVGAPGSALRLIAARHALLLARGIAAVPFDLDMTPPERTLLISGPNTGGKTVLLKTVGLAIALTQSGVIAPLGLGSVVPMVTRMFVDIGDHQSLAADLSTFSAHVAALRRLLAEADDSTLVLVDEIGSGTDPAEGGALATATLEALTGRRALTLATTHLGALKSLATHVAGVVNGSLHFDGATLSPTYRFVKGIPGRSYGLAIARRLGVEASVLARADALVPEHERELDRLLAEVEARRQALDHDEALVRQQAADVASREAVVRNIETAHHAREIAWRQQEKTAARDRARQAKAYLLEARKQVEAALALASGAANDAMARQARQLVEEGIREQAHRLDEGDAVVAATDSPLRPGVRVRLNTGASGDVLEVRGDGRVVVRVGTMRLVVAAATLTPLPPERAPTSRSAIAVDQAATDAATELDLRGMRADEAESAVVMAIDRSVLADQPRLAIIHGMGTGVLRDVVRRLLSTDARVASFDFAPRQQGGVGVTVATFR